MLERQDLELLFTPLDNKVDRILDHLEKLNSKTEKHAIEIAVLQAKATTTVKSTRNQSAAWGTGAGAFVGGLVIAIYQFFAK